MENLQQLKDEEAVLNNQLAENRKKQQAAVEAEKHKGKPMTFEDACVMLKLDSKKEIPESLPDHVKAYMQLCIITKALNEGWVPDWTDSNEYKYYPWFDLSKGVSGFSYGGYSTWGTGTNAASRLCFKSSELAKFAGTQFVEIYRVYITQ